MSERSPHHQGLDTATRTLVAIGAALVLLIAVVLGVADVMNRYFSAQRPAPVVRTEPPKPRLDPQPARRLVEFLQEKRTRLEGYGWVDRERNVVHIPIERAMTLLADRHRRDNGAGGKR